MSDPKRGELWDLDLNPVVGREQAGFRPALILSVDLFNAGPADLVVAVPLTRTQRNVRWHVRIRPPEVASLLKASPNARTFVRSLSTDSNADEEKFPPKRWKKSKIAFASY